MKYIITLLVIAILFSGCTTTAGVMEAANQNHIGKSFDGFVKNYGPPQGKYQLDNGDNVYTWSFSGQVMMLGTTIYNGSANAYSYGNTATAYGTGTATTFGGGISNRICVLNILTTKDNIIKEFSIMKNTPPALPGYSSMCARGLSRE